MICWHAIAKENCRLVRVPVLIMDWILGSLHTRRMQKYGKRNYRYQGIWWPIRALQWCRWSFWQWRVFKFLARIFSWTIFLRWNITKNLMFKIYAILWEIWLLLIHFFLFLAENSENKYREKTLTCPPDSLFWRAI